MSYIAHDEGVEIEFREAVTEEDLVSDEECVSAVFFSNGAMINVKLYREPLEDQYPSDRIQLTMLGADGGRTVILMTVHEALVVCSGLNEAAFRAVDQDLPLS